MIYFAHRKYKSYKPRTFAKWCEAIRKEEQFVKTIDNPMEYFGKCRPYNLVSSHPYWKMVSAKNSMVFIKNTQGEINALKKLLEVNPNHYYKGNILANISRLTKVINQYEVTTITR